MVSILIADDDVQFNQMLSDYLTLQGHRVISARDGKQALTCFIDEKPDIAIIDIRMPKKDGLDFLLKVRDTDMHQAKGIILISGTDNTRGSGYSEIVRQLGASDFLHKPFSLDLIGEKIQSILELTE